MKERSLQVIPNHEYVGWVIHVLFGGQDPEAADQLDGWTFPGECNRIINYLIKHDVSQWLFA